LQGGADFVLEFVGAELRIETANADAAAVGMAQAFEHFDRAGLACAIGAEQAEDFAFFDVEAHATDGLDFAVALDEIFHLQN